MKQIALPRYAKSYAQSAAKSIVALAAFIAVVASDIPARANDILSVAFTAFPPFDALVGVILFPLLVAVFVVIMWYIFGKISQSIIKILLIGVQKIDILAVALLLLLLATGTGFKNEDWTETASWWALKSFWSALILGLVWQLDRSKRRKPFVTPWTWICAIALVVINAVSEFALEIRGAGLAVFLPGFTVALLGYVVAARNWIEKRRVEEMRGLVLAVAFVTSINWGIGLIGLSEGGWDRVAIGWNGALLVILYFAQLLLIGFVMFGAAVSESEQREEKTQAKQTGEEETARALSRHLNSNWILLTGYKNSKGEIDQILVGPGGVTAIAINTGEMHITGDRDTSLQLNEPASQLQEFLSEHAGVKRVNRAVILTDDNPRIDNRVNSSGGYFVTLDDIRHRNQLVFVFGVGQVSLDKDAVKRVSDLIQQDHDFHNKSSDERGRMRNAGRKRERNSLR